MMDATYATWAMNSDLGTAGTVHRVVGGCISALIEFSVFGASTGCCSRTVWRGVGLLVVWGRCPRDLSE